MKEYKPFKSGKVRELYDLGDSLVMVCTDRISAFDNILKCPIPEKGCVLNRMSKFWFDLTKDIVPNHMISIDTKDMPEFFQTAEFEDRSMKTQKLDMIPVECIVRGFDIIKSKEVWNVVKLVRLKREGTVLSFALEITAFQSRGTYEEEKYRTDRSDGDR